MENKENYIDIEYSKKQSRENNFDISKEKNTIDLEKLSLEERMSFLLNNQKTIEQINCFPDNHRDKIVGNLIEYLIIFPNSLEVANYLEDLISSSSLLKEYGTSYGFNEKNIELIIRNILKELNLEKIDSEESKEKVLRYFLEKFIKNGYYFHSFNGSFENSIREKGLNTDTRFWDWKELKRISEIGSKVGNPMILGWADLNCQSKISMADRPENICRYAYASPEWFTQFTSEGWHILDDKEAFYKKDYDSAKRNITMFCDRLMSKSEEEIKAGKAYRNIILEEKLEILKFFEKYWKILANNGSLPKCALISRSIMSENENRVNSFEEYCEEAKKLKFLDDYSLEKVIDFLMYSIHPDIQLDQIINPKDIKIISIPEYSKIHGK